MNQKERQQESIIREMNDDGEIDGTGVPGRADRADG